MKPASLTSCCLASLHTQTSSLSCLGSSWPCTWSLCWGTYSSSWPLALTLTSTPPCTYFWPSNPLLAPASPEPLSLRCWSTSRHSTTPSPTLGSSCNVLLHSIDAPGWLPAGCDVIWPLHGHLPLSSLHPNHFTQWCLLLVTTSWFCNHLMACSLTLMSWFYFCSSHSILHFFCDLHPLLKLACTDTHIFQVMMFAAGSLSGMVPLTCVLISYAHIILPILRVPFPGGTNTIFCTCDTHLTVITLLYGTLFLVYFQPSSSYSADTGMVASVVYMTGTPMLTPLCIAWGTGTWRRTCADLLGVEDVPPHKKSFPKWEAKTFNVLSFLHVSSINVKSSFKTGCFAFQEM